MFSLLLCSSSIKSFTLFFISDWVYNNHNTEELHGMDDKISQIAIDSVAKHINERSTKPYGIPVIGNKDNIESPQIFEIIPFEDIDKSEQRIYAIDGSTSTASFYNGICIGLYRAGYVCYQSGKQVRMNDTDDPVILGQSYTPKNILITCEDHCFAIYDEMLSLPSVKNFLAFLGDEPKNIFPYTREVVCQSVSTLLPFCQEILELSLIYEIANRPGTKSNDIILVDGDLRSLNVKQEYLVKLGKYLSQDKHIILVAITKNSPIKIELSYTFRQIDNYLQDKLKPQYPFNETNPKRQKLCCWFEVPDSVLLGAYGDGSMFARKALTGGRGTGLFFAARLDYVEKLQNYDWVIVDVNIFDAIPGIEQKDMRREAIKLEHIFKELTRLTQEHYILGYPYPLVEAHNFITLASDLKDEIINRVKQSMYQTQYMDHIDIENMFIDIHSRF